ncbi:MAG: hypothetical protein HP496_14985, partial [Nitrospira sp.]|nr:hypothetical protein [Nitrospira sp.]
GRSERRGESYSGPYVEPLSEARTPLADFFRILLISVIAASLEFHSNVTEEVVYQVVRTRFTLAALVLTARFMMETGSAFGEPNKVEKAAAAKVSIDEAIATARENVPGTVIDVELEQKHDRLIWGIEVVTPEKQVKKIHIDAQMRSVIDVEEEKMKSKRIHRRN